MRSMMPRPFLACLLLSLVARSAFADYEYRYIEGERFNRGEAQGIREEGFTPWMAHPSGGKVAVFGRPAGGFLEYDIDGLQEGAYTIRIRCLAQPTAKTDVVWDGKDLGLITHDQASTSLRWSEPLGPVRGAGKHVLRLQGSDDTSQTPYIDVILLTNVNEFVPPAKDQDFIGYRTAWPLLEIKGATGSRFVAPLPPEGTPGASTTNGPGASEIRVLALAMPSPVLGTSDLRLRLGSARAESVNLSIGLKARGSRAVSGQRRSGPLRLPANAPQPVTVSLVASSTGSDTMAVRVGAGNTSIEGRYPLEIPRLASVSLDAYAYPSSQRAGRWTATATAATDVLAGATVDLVIRDLQAGTTILHKTLPLQARLDVPFDLAGLPVGRFRADAVFRVGGQRAQADSLEFIHYAAASFPAWEPVRQARAVGDRIIVNGKPFLPRLLYHAPAVTGVVSHGFNVVQCSGADPDPLPSIRNQLDACQKVGLYGSVALFNNRYFNAGQRFNLARLEDAVRKFKDHPALLCWDLIDEPDGSGMKPAAVAEAAGLIRRIDPDHFVWVNLSRNTGVSDYLASQDLWSYDYYPFPQMTPFEYKTRWLDRTDQLLAGKMPLGVCLQTYAYDRNEQRMPTPDELRTSAWLHILHGYTWFGYYSLNEPEPAGCLARDPVLFSYTRALNAQLVQLENVILAPGKWTDVPMAPNTNKLEAREKEVGGRLYVVVVSDGRGPLRVTLSPSWSNARRRLLIESDRAPVGGPFETTVRPEATQVWELTR